MLWYLADGSLNDYLKSQVVLQGKYYSGQQTDVKQVSFASNSGVLTLEQLTLVNLNDYQPQNALIIDQIKVQLAPVQASPYAKSKNNDISKQVQHITVESIVINKLRINLTDAIAESSSSNLTLLQQQVSQKLAADYPALYPEIAAKLYAKQHPDLNASLVTIPQNSLIQKPVIETNQAVIEANASKQKKRLLGKATTRITILAFTVKTFEINHTTKDGSNTIQYFNNIKLPVIGKEHGLASNQVGGEVLRLLLNKAKQLQ